VEGNRHDRIKGGMTKEVRCPVGHETAQRSAQRIPPAVLEEKEDLAEGIIPFIKKGRPSEKVLRLPNSAT
jgi:hypothetical protein